ncbi:MULTISPECIES: hypothetical protein [Thermomonosporaceae]|uniref:hypothetical protein n=1 Tax=Thermomonosporaceae TaxID=2012 RepID=UPI00255AB9EC|nr:MULTISPECIES: hypothetical protein [Thermomonosporaceae]MDL4773019.1 hypothetical protein [Actinomadura xylanilytica]
MDSVIVRVVGGPFMGVEGEMMPGPAEGMVTVHTTTSPYTWRKAEVRTDAVEPVAVEGLSPRCWIAWEHHDAGEAEKTMFWVERVHFPEDDLAAEWDAYLAHVIAVDAATERSTAEALARFDRELALLEEAEVAARAEADMAYWWPMSAKLERIVPLQERAVPDDMTDEERLELAIAGLVRRHPSIWDLAEERRDAARPSGN